MKLIEETEDYLLFEYPEDYHGPGSPAGQARVPKMKILPTDGELGDVVSVNGKMMVCVNRNDEWIEVSGE